MSVSPTVEPSNGWLARGRRRPASATSLASVGDGRREVRALGDEVGLAVELDERADVAVDDDVDRAFGRPRGRRACRAWQALRAQPVLRRLEVAVGLLERLLAVHHPGAGRLAQRRDVLAPRSQPSVALLHLGRCAGVGRRASARGGSARRVGSAPRRGAAAACLRLGRGQARLALGLLRRRPALRACGLLARPSPPAPRASAASARRPRPSCPAGRPRFCARWRPSSTASAIDAAHEVGGADGVVVAGDHVVDDVGVAVGVDDRDHRDAEAVGLGDRDVLLLRVDHEDRARAAARGCGCRRGCARAWRARA